MTGKLSLQLWGPLLGTCGSPHFEDPVENCSCARVQKHLKEVEASTAGLCNCQLCKGWMSGNANCGMKFQEHSKYGGDS